jgi:hypothetical protein
MRLTNSTLEHGEHHVVSNASQSKSSEAAKQPINPTQANAATNQHREPITHPRNAAISYPTITDPRRPPTQWETRGTRETGGAGDDLQGSELLVEGGLVALEVRGVVLGHLAPGRSPFLLLPRAVPHRSARAPGRAPSQRPVEKPVERQPGEMLKLGDLRSRGARGRGGL